MRVVEHLLVGADGAPVAFRESPNWTHGTFLEPEYLVMHFTAGRHAASAVDWFLDPAAQASAHLVIGRDGDVTQLVRFDRIAWHAGVSRWNGRQGLNRWSIGIELDNPGRLTRADVGRWRAWFGGEYTDADIIQQPHRDDPVGTPPSGWLPYPDVQLEAAFAAAEALVAAYGLRDVVGHDDVAPLRKSDPGPAFPMASFRSRLYGRVDDTAPVFVTTDTLNIRAGAAADALRLTGGPLPPGTRVERLSTRGTWWLVDVLDVVNEQMDLQGWIHSRYVRPA